MMTKSIKIFLIVAFTISICFIITFQLFDTITKYYIYLGLGIIIITFIKEK